ncbi:Fe-S cluster assembly iron-binding protein IscA [Oikeobacillus pervagus]|uniref:Fe-S cluster assembly iron-binding protein IscA n=1 Tax=Oikeobacillus pervagus TaxID=1325931 RepID=A0AAJ1WIQ8_9BACI|nr:Fe-S cluster assembly iron-binding protein IscA [Oikeobacillus pervagus]
MMIITEDAQKYIREKIQKSKREIVLRVAVSGVG